MLVRLSLGFLVSFVIISNVGNLQLVSSSGDVPLSADFYNTTTISRIAFGSCRYFYDEKTKWRHSASTVRPFKISRL